MKTVRYQCTKNKQKEFVDLLNGNSQQSVEQFRIWVTNTSQYKFAFQTLNAG